MCATGFTGYNCSEDINECEPNPCQNGGNCTNFLNGNFTCECPSGYSGDICSTDLTPCDPQPCGGGGTCNDLGEGAYSCDCSLPLYWDSTSNSCIAQCPLFTFGNHTLAQCQPCKSIINAIIPVSNYSLHVRICIYTVPDVFDRGVQADATAYFGSIQTNATFETQVFHFRIVIDLSIFNNDLAVIAVFLVGSNFIEQIFKFSDGQNLRVFEIGLNGGIDAVNTSRAFPEIRLIENRLVVYEDYVIYQAFSSPSIELPIILNFDIYFIVLGQNLTVIQEFFPLAVGTITLILPPGICIHCCQCFRNSIHY